MVGFRVGPMLEMPSITVKLKTDLATGQEPSRMSPLTVSEFDATILSYPANAFESLVNCAQDRCH
jgi:hypothetical protein